ncbi:MFS transporter (macronuclear) [Tetrahymena thermophila SB210]|uniref:MFS transporter n=1 Tax=Tetrahymena thermophila (strain SB210) TaxID=312017 RepID=Q23UD6_TETTS|nr:MFS transporter [Tetrahymena thermophila SB210]EAS00129.2 MFS transporter [Tetrahymena thermophila SB210]|eukprot:XP_001020374.2 MFS transporter [Tetrahymena thermophila SB210]
MKFNKKQKEMQESYQIAHKPLEEQDNDIQEQKIVDLSFKPEVVEDKKLELKQKLIQEQIPVQFVIHEHKQNGGVKESQQQKGANSYYKHNYQIQQSTDDLEKQQNPSPQEEHADQKHDQNQGNVEEKGRHHGHKLQKPKLYAYRWVILVLYLLGDLGPSMMVTTTTPNANQLSKIYDLLPIEANLGSLVILIFTPIGTIFSSKFLDQKGLSVSIRVGIFVCAIGAWMRCLVNYSYYFVVAGNILTGLGSPFIFNGKTQVASNWFSHEQGPGVTSFITFWTNLNGIAGMMFAGNFMGSYRYDASNEEEGKTLVFELMLLIAIVVTSIGVLLWIFFRQHPPTPPSFTAQIEREQNFKESVVHLIKNRNYVFIVIQQGLILGSINGMSTSISYFISPYGFDSADSTFMLAAIPIGGVFGIIIGSYFLNKYKKYKYQMGIYMIGGTGCMFLFQLVLYTKSIFLAVGSAAIVGLFFVPLIPAFLEFACESVFPIGEGSAVGFLSSVNGIFSLIYGSVLSFIVKGQSQTESFLGTIILLSSFGLAFLLLFLTKERLRRDEVEKISCQKFQEGKEVDISDFHFDDDNGNSAQVSSVQFNANEIEKQERLEQPLQVKQESNQVEIEIATISQNHNNNNNNINDANHNNNNNNNNFNSHSSNNNSTNSNNNTKNHHIVNAKANGDSASEQESAFSSSSTTDFSSTDSQQYKQNGDSNKQVANEKQFLSDSLSPSANHQDQLSENSQNQNESNNKKANKRSQKDNHKNGESSNNVSSSSSSKQHSVNNGSSYEEIEESEEEQEDSQNKNSVMEKGLGLKKHLINEKDFESYTKKNKHNMKNGHNN